LAAAKITSWGFSVSANDLNALANAVGEKTLLNRTGGAPAFAVGMAHIFSRSLGGDAVMALWYHFALMFEGLFILTVIDAGTRVGRFLLQDSLGHIWKPLGKQHSYPAIVGTSAVMVAMWGWFLWQGIHDPLGGINSLWPLFGIANQLLATVALSVATTIVIKSGRLRYVWVTLVPMIWLVLVTFTAGLEKMFHPNPRIGFLTHARELANGVATAQTPQLIFNDRLNAAVTGVLLLLVGLMLAQSLFEWARVLLGRKQAVTKEAPYVQSRLVGEIGN
jgi:carbon starvation protein